MEVKASDLRIGNVLRTAKGTTCIVITISGGYISVAAPKDNVTDFPMPYSPIEGIPLSYEVLEKCGFVNVTHDRWELKISGKKRFVLHEVGLDNRRFVFVPRYGGIKGGIDYVHQLMNAYYILTGEELIVTL